MVTLKELRGERGRVEGDEGALTLRRLIRDFTLKSILTPIKVWLKEHLTTSPSIWDRKEMPLYSFVGNNGVVRVCRVACQDSSQDQLPAISERRRQALSCLCQRHMLFPLESRGKGAEGKVPSQPFTLW